MLMILGKVNIFLYRTQSTNHKKKVKLELIKIKNFCLSNNFIKKANKPAGSVAQAVGAAYS